MIGVRILAVVIKLFLNQYRVLHGEIRRQGRVSGPLDGALSIMRAHQSGRPPGLPQPAG
jgi:hypothetical protein